MNPQVSPMGEMGGRQRRSVATAEKICLGLRVGGGSVCAEGC